jgi:hypothetical protein
MNITKTNTQANQLTSRNTEILEAMAGYCPNGCLAEFVHGCYCNGSYPNNKEAGGNKKESLSMAQ